MLPRVDIVRWRAVAPWADDDDVEHDLVITLVLFDIFRDETLESALAFRGGTVLHKLHLSPAARYSEDIDLVQREPGPIGPTLSRLRRVLGWIGPARSDTGERRTSDPGPRATGSDSRSRRARGGGARAIGPLRGRVACRRPAGPGRPPSASRSSGAGRGQVASTSRHTIRFCARVVRPSSPRASSDASQPIVTTCVV